MDVSAPLLRNASVPYPAPQHQPQPTPATRDPAVLVDVLVLSTDLRLFDAIRGAIGERNPVWRARSAEESVDLLLTGRCGVLLVDMAAVSSAPTTLITQVVEQFPDVVVVVAGHLEDEAQLARLIRDGFVYRFMHKPLTAKRAGMFLHAAIRRHVEQRGQRPAQSALPLSTMLPARFDTSKWLFVATGVVIFLALLWLFAGGGLARLSGRSASAAPAVATSTQPLADPVLSRARAALVAGRYEAPSGRNALDLYAAVLLSRPDQVEARAGLDRTIDHLVGAARLAEAEGNPAEARRLLARLQSAEASNPAVSALAEFLAPAPTPLAARAAEPALAPRPTPAVSVPAPVEAPVAPPPAAFQPGNLPGRAVAAVPPVSSGHTAIHPKAPSPVTRPASTARRAVVRPDPLTPTIVNADQIRADLLRAQRTPRPARSAGLPAVARLPIAGYVNTPEPAPPAEEQALPAANPDIAAALAMPSDELDRVYSTDPAYPTAALHDRVEGWVELGFTITETGSVRDIEVLASTPPGVFESAASQALESWRFKPRLANGQAVARRSTVTLRFDIDR